jgi:hypothetical protein
MPRNVRLASIAAAALAIVACAAPAAAQLGVEMRLENAGFIMRRADTLQKLDRMQQLPQRRFIPRTSPDGRRYYVWVDASGCGCSYVGGQTARDAFRDMPAQPPQPDVVGPGSAADRGDRGHENMMLEMNTDMDEDAGIFSPDDDLYAHPF